MNYCRIEVHLMMSTSNTTIPFSSGCIIIVKFADLSLDSLLLDVTQVASYHALDVLQDLIVFYSNLIQIV